MNTEKPTPKKRNSRGEDYVNNKIFSEAVAEYVKLSNDNKAAGIEHTPIPNYVAECIMKICNGLSRSPSFASYSYREDMVMDAVENCIKAIYNYNIDASTRTGNPNAFSYFTQISYFAFLRRLAKEKKQATIKQALIDKGSIGNFAEFDGDDTMQIGETLIEKIRQKNDDFYDCKKEIGNGLIEVIEPKKPATKRARRDGPLLNFID
jgi:hypothetical protein